MKRAEQKAATKKKIQDAFYQILAYKPIETITVKEIAENANVDRKTFYLYFNTVYDVLYSLEFEIIEQFKHSISKEPILDFNKLFDYIEVHILENENILTDLIHRPSFSSLADQFNKIFSEEIRKLLKKDIWRNEDEIQLEFYASGIFGIYQSWLRSDKSIPIYEYTQFLKNKLGKN